MLIETPKELELCQNLLTEAEAEWLRRSALEVDDGPFATEEEQEASQSLIERGLIIEEVIEDRTSYTWIDTATDQGRIVLACYQAARKP
jgi:hypothetical protein